MARQAQAAQQWAEIVAEAEAAGVPHAEVALKHSLPALKYHLYKSRKSGATSRGPRLLPVRLGDEPLMVDAHVGAVRLSFPEGCSPSYVAAVLAALQKASC